VNNVIRAGSLAFFCLGALPEMASAQRAYDGQWSVVIVTQRGPCERAHRHGVFIQAGRVIQDDSIVGRVAANGAVSVRVTSPIGSASGSGRLSHNSGRGNWSGYSGVDQCSGYWTAERRG
jgi:hypothetical protein